MMPVSGCQPFSELGQHEGRTYENVSLLGRILLPEKNQYIKLYLRDEIELVFIYLNEFHFFCVPDKKWFIWPTSGGFAGRLEKEWMGQQNWCPDQWRC